MPRDVWTNEAIHECGVKVRLVYNVPKGSPRHVEFQVWRELAADASQFVDQFAPVAREKLCEGDITMEIERKGRYTIITVWQELEGGGKYCGSARLEGWVFGSYLEVKLYAAIKRVNQARMRLEGRQLAFPALLAADAPF